ncbi:DUF1014-domain-containing protein [Gymnopus androsaceus JB14]|uniref:DUF1014-domain-containing protein n=1 Tax=Gymnopus androsaceus JB14 TaxID=1447944 RepID=A0A6A4HAT2_9AGAR|nr:DUF1014-domain-containing protein [Gymnopus androsaceus JB14]
MAPKGGNAKKESGRAKKAENEAKKQEAANADKEKKESQAWDSGSKSKQSAAEAKEEKRKAELARKAENARILAEEEAAAPPKVKPAPKAAAKKSSKASPATGIDNMLDLLDVVTAKADKASVGSQAAGIERHPERRFKAAFEAYQERELPNARKEHPGLRLQQYKDLLYKQFQKSPENPFNQTTISYDASKDDKIQALNAKKAQVEERLRERPREY